MAWLLRTWIGLCLVTGLLGMAMAQKPELAPSEALGCLTPKLGSDEVPEYPLRPFQRGEGGVVKLELAFAGPETQADVQVLAQEGHDDFVSAVRAHVRKLRVPCHPGGNTQVRLQLEFLFKPDDRKVLWQKPVDLADAERKRAMQCLTHPSGSTTPEYPLSAQRRGLQGRVIARARFSAPDQPPVVEVFARPSAQVLAANMKGWIEDYRLPCLSGQPVTLEWVFVFRLGDDAFGFKPGLTLMQLLPIVKGIRQQTLDHDLNSMACPFELRWLFRQPFLPNRVGEVGEHQPSRQALLDWLATVDLDLPRETLHALYGDTLHMVVPCGSIRLQPQQTPAS